MASSVSNATQRATSLPFVGTLGVMSKEPSGRLQDQLTTWLVAIVAGVAMMLAGRSVRGLDAAGMIVTAVGVLGALFLAARRFDRKG